MDDLRVPKCQSRWLATAKIDKLYQAYSIKIVPFFTRSSL